MFSYCVQEQNVLEEYEDKIWVKVEQTEINSLILESYLTKGLDTNIKQKNQRLLIS